MDSKIEKTPMQRFNKAISSVQTQEYLKSVLAGKKEAFVNNITALVANDAKLQECTPMSLIYAGIKATALDLPLDNNLGLAYVIPYNNTKTRVVRKQVADPKTGELKVVEDKEVSVVKEAQLQLGYRAFIQLSIRSGQFRTINVADVREGEITGTDFLSGEMMFSMAGKGRSGLKVVGYVAFFSLVNGFRKMLYMSVEEIEAHAKRYSKTYGSRYEKTRSESKWATDFDAMAKKTVLKLLLNRYAPLSVQMQEGVRFDQAAFDEIGSATFIDAPDEQEQSERLIEDKKEEMRGKETAAPDMP